MASIADYTGNSARANVEKALAAAKSNESYHALLSLTEARALKRADAVDRGEITGRLAGVPFVVTRLSGSLPTFPITVIVFMFIALLFS